MRTVHMAPRNSNLQETVTFSPFSNREAALLRRSIYQCAYGDNSEPTGFSTYVCLSGRDGEAQLNEMATLLNQVCLETVSHLRYITLIDAERLSIDAQRNLKSLMNRAGVVFILVVNHLTTIDAGILDRCVRRIYLEIPSIEQLRGLLSAALTSSGINPSDELLENVVRSSRSCFLDIYMMIQSEFISRGITEPTHL